MIIKRIKNVIREHYAEGAEEILNLSVFPVVQRMDGDDKTGDIYFVQLAVAYLSDDDYTIHTETVRVDDNGMSGLEFTLINETDTQMKDAL